METPPWDHVNRYIRKKRQFPRFWWLKADGGGDSKWGQICLSEKRQGSKTTSAFRWSKGKSPSYTMIRNTDTTQKKQTSTHFYINPRNGIQYAQIFSNKIQVPNSCTNNVS